MNKQNVVYTYGSPGGSDGKDSACNAEDPGSILGLGRSPGARNHNPLQYSCLGNAMDRGAGWVQSMGSQSLYLQWNVIQPLKGRKF